MATDLSRDIRSTATVTAQPQPIVFVPPRTLPRGADARDQPRPSPRCVKRGCVRGSSTSQDEYTCHLFRHLTIEKNSVRHFGRAEKGSSAPARTTEHTRGNKENEPHCCGLASQSPTHPPPLRRGLGPRRAKVATTKRVVPGSTGSRAGTGRDIGTSIQSGTPKAPNQDAGEARRTKYSPGPSRVSARIGFDRTRVGERRMPIAASPPGTTVYSHSLEGTEKWPSQAPGPGTPPEALCTRADGWIKSRQRSTPNAAEEKTRTPAAIR